jgi:hypothetical protein
VSHAGLGGRIAPASGTHSSSLARLIVAATLAVGVSLAVGCGEDEPQKRDRAHNEDIQLGTGEFRGVKLGDSEQRLRAVLGAPKRKLRGEAASRAMPAVSVPYAIPDRDQTSRISTDIDWVYPGVTIRTAFGRVYAFYVTGRGIGVRGGARIGDDLDVAHESHPKLDCEPDEFETGTIEKCDGRIAAGRYVWYGGDPIDVLILEDKPIG